MTDESARLRELMAVEPPEFLDALVQERAAAVLARRAAVHCAAVHCEAVHCEAEAQGPELAGPRALPRAIAPAERFVYASGLALYGAQALYGLARLLLRALAG